MLIQIKYKANDKPYYLMCEEDIAEEVKSALNNKGYNVYSISKVLSKSPEEKSQAATKTKEM